MSCNPPSLSPIKVGDTLSLACIYKVDGVPTDLTPYTITAMLKTSADVLVLTFVVTKAVQGTDPGVFVLSTVPNPPSPELPIDALRCDIQFVTTATGVVRSSQTFILPVEQQVTTP